MKIKYIIAGIFAAGFISLSQAQDVASAREYSNNSSNASPTEIEISDAAESNLEKNADIQTLRMKDVLGLDDEQFQEVREINMAYAEDVYRATAECNNADLKGELTYMDITRDKRFKIALTKKQYREYQYQKNNNNWGYENFRVDCLLPDNTQANSESDYNSANPIVVWVRPEYANMPLSDPGTLFPNVCTLSSKNATTIEKEDVYTFTENGKNVELKRNGDKFKEKKNKSKVKVKGEKEKVKTVHPNNPGTLEVKTKDKYKEHKQDY